MPQMIEVPGYGQVEFPDGMDDNQIVEAIQRNMVAPEGHPFSGDTPEMRLKAMNAPPKPKWTTPEQEMQPYIESLSTPEKFLIGAGKGFVDIGTGAVQRGAQIGEKLGVVTPETTAGIEKGIEENRKIFNPLEQQSFAAKAGEFVGQNAPTVVIPGGVAGGTARRLATAAGAGALAGALQPTTKDESTIANTVTGALTGGGTSAAMSGAGKAINALRGKVPVNEIARLGGKYGIPTTLGEVTGNPTVQHAETLLEKVPVIGLRKFRKQQQDATEETAKGFLARYMADPNHPEIMSANREYVDGLYEGVKNIARDVKKGITPSETKTATQSLLNDYPDILKKFQDTKMEGVLKDIAKGVRNKTTPSPTAWYGDEVTSVVPTTLSFDEAWTLRKGLGEMIGQARKKLASGDINETQHAQLKTLFRAIDSDMEKWAGQTGKPEIMSGLKEANDAYRDKIVKYDIIQRAYDKAAGTVGAGETFSPKKFSTALKNIAYKDKAYKLFSPLEIEEMTGIANIMQAVKRSGQYAENPPTGARWGAPLIAAATGLKTIPFITAARFLSGTNTGKSLALASSKIEPDSPAMGKIMKAVYNMLPKTMASAATDDNPQEGEINE